jgi:rod shape-determining protein MreC
VQNLPTLVAQVISGPTSNFEDTFEIDRGTASGVGVGMPVVAGAGLVGVITAAGSSTAVVETITNPGSQFGVRFGTAGDVAVADGRGPGYDLELSGVTQSMIPRVGQTVFSSGLTGASLPAGIPVGTITSVSGGAGNLTQRVVVRPLAQFQDLSYVTVLQWFPAP